MFEIVPRHDKLFTAYMFEIAPMFETGTRESS
jgi:hypothetical protein